MSRHFVVRGIQVGLIAGSFGDTGFRVIRGDDGRKALEVFKGADVRADPARQILAPGGFGEGITAEAHGGDEDRGLVDFARLAVVDGNGGAGIVDKQFLAGGVLLAECEFLSAAPLLVTLALHDPNHHALTIDIGDSQVDRLADSHSGGVDRA